MENSRVFFEIIDLKTIWILAREGNIEISFQGSRKVSPVESIHCIPDKILFEFINSWQNWVKQIDGFSFALSEKNHDYTDRFQEFSHSLSSILFGNFSIDFSDTTIWIMDREILSLPIEILKNHSNQIFYRNIRSSRVPPVGKIGEDFLFVENHYQAENLLEEQKKEKQEILELWDSHNIRYKELIGISCTRIRFIEKIASVKIFHYSGHSYEDGLRFIGDSHLKLSDISNLNLSNLELASLNSCLSASGLAGSFLEAGAREVVGFLGPVRNDISRQAGQIFWETYCSTKSASLSVERVRTELQLTHGKGYPAAFQFVHFGLPEINKSFLSKKNIGLMSLSFLFILFLLNYITYTYNQKNKVIPNVAKSEIGKPLNERIPEKPEAQVESLYQNNNPPKNMTHKKRPVENSNQKELNTLHSQSYDTDGSKLKRSEKYTNMAQNYYVNDFSQSRLEKYISALSSDRLKISIRRYLQKKDPIVSMERKQENIENILKTTESEELIEYKLRELE